MQPVGIIPDISELLLNQRDHWVTWRYADTNDCAIIWQYQPYFTR
jgi:hypothetical protein